jgi:thiamine-monophosphate kinase
MKLSDIGEFGFIREIASPFFEHLSENIVGIGDDCAVIPISESESQIVTTDMLIEDTHFIFDKITPFELGQKSLAVNLSDIAAMGGTPTSAFISLGIPDKVSLEWLKEFYEGLSFLAKQHKTPILGGDTTKSVHGLIINIAVLGKVDNTNVKMRSGAQAGDLICVTETLGNSACGLNFILKKLAISTPEEREMFRAHNLPRPHLAEGSFLTKQEGVSAMMDVSDGIDSDLKRIMERSQVGAKIKLENIPLSESLKHICDEYQWNALRFAVTGGEDYCLLCTIKKDAYHNIQDLFKKNFHRDLYVIGEMDNSNTLTYLKNGHEFHFDQSGYDHFKSETI